MRLLSSSQIDTDRISKLSIANCFTILVDFPPLRNLIVSILSSIYLFLVVLNKKL